MKECDENPRLIAHNIIESIMSERRSVGLFMPFHVEYHDDEPVKAASTVLFFHCTR